MSVCAARIEPKQADHPCMTGRSTSEVPLSASLTLVQEEVKAKTSTVISTDKCSLPITAISRGRDKHVLSRTINDQAPFKSQAISFPGSSEDMQKLVPTESKLDVFLVGKETEYGSNITPSINRPNCDECLFVKRKFR